MTIHIGSSEFTNLPCREERSERERERRVEAVSWIRPWVSIPGGWGWGIYPPNISVGGGGGLYNHPPPIIHHKKKKMKRKINDESPMRVVNDNYSQDDHQYTHFAFSFS